MFLIEKVCSLLNSITSSLLSDVTQLGSSRREEDGNKGLHQEPYRGRPNSRD